MTIVRIVPENVNNNEYVYVCAQPPELDNSIYRATTPIKRTSDRLCVCACVHLLQAHLHCHGIIAQNVKHTNEKQNETIVSHWNWNGNERSLFWYWAVRANGKKTKTENVLFSTLLQQTVQQVINFDNKLLFRCLQWMPGTLFFVVGLFFWFLAEFLCDKL